MNAITFPCLTADNLPSRQLLTYLNFFSSQPGDQLHRQWFTRGVANEWGELYFPDPLPPLGAEEIARINVFCAAHPWIFSLANQLNAVVELFGPTAWPLLGASYVQKVHAITPDIPSSPTLHLRFWVGAIKPGVMGSEWAPEVYPHEPHDAFEGWCKPNIRVIIAIRQQRKHPVRVMNIGIILSPEGPVVASDVGVQPLYDLVSKTTEIHPGGYCEAPEGFRLVSPFARGKMQMKGLSPEDLFHHWERSGKNPLAAWQICRWLEKSACQKLLALLPRDCSPWIDAVTRGDLSVREVDAILQMVGVVMLACFQRSLVEVDRQFGAIAIKFCWPQGTDYLPLRCGEEEVFFSAFSRTPDSVEPLVRDMWKQMKKDFTIASSIPLMEVAETLSLQGSQLHCFAKKLLNMRLATTSEMGAVLLASLAVHWKAYPYAKGDLFMVLPVLQQEFPLWCSAVLGEFAQDGMTLMPPKGGESACVKWLTTAAKTKNPLFAAKAWDMLHIYGNAWSEKDWKRLLLAFLGNNHPLVVLGEPAQSCLIGSHTTYLEWLAEAQDPLRLLKRFPATVS